MLLTNSILIITLMVDYKDLEWLPYEKAGSNFVSDRLCR